MTAFGSSEKADKAKSILEHAAIGLVIVLAAYAISTFVFSSLTGATNSTQTNTPSASAACAQTTNETACTDLTDAGGGPLCSWFVNEMNAGLFNIFLFRN